MNSLSPSHPLHIPLGFVLWSVWFVGVYGGLSVACAVAPPPAVIGPWNWLNAVLALFTLATAVLLLGLGLRCERAAHRRTKGAGRKVDRFVARVAAVLYLVAALATLYVGVPIMALPPCA